MGFSLMELESISVKNAYAMLQEYVNIHERQQKDMQKRSEITRNRQKRGMKTPSRKANKDDVDSFFN